MSGNDIGERLRRIRHQQDLSLADVEQRSEGLWKAVVVGAYERGDRAVSITRLAALADFYGVPLADLLSDHRNAAKPPRDDTTVVLDLTALEHRDLTQPVAAMARFADQIRLARGDHNGRVLSLRGSDVDTVALTTGTAPTLLMAALREEGALLGSGS